MLFIIIKFSILNSTINVYLLQTIFQAVVQLSKNPSGMAVIGDSPASCTRARLRAVSGVSAIVDSPVSCASKTTRGLAPLDSPVSCASKTSKGGRAPLEPTSMSEDDSDDEICGTPPQQVRRVTRSKDKAPVAALALPLVVAAPVERSIVKQTVAVVEAACAGGRNTRSKMKAKKDDPVNDGSNASGGSFKVPCAPGTPGRLAGKLIG